MCTGPQREHDFDVVIGSRTLEKTHGASTGARFASLQTNMVRKWRELTPTLSSYKAFLRQDGSDHGRIRMSTEKRTAPRRELDFQP